MKKGITTLIPENIAPPDAVALAIFDGSKKICDVDISGMRPGNMGELLYRFGVVADLHVTEKAVGWNPVAKLDNALTHFENEGCVMCIACGDLTQTGFYRRTDEGDASTTYLDERQFAQYKAICDGHGIPVHALMGNHESYYGMPIANNLELMEAYTGRAALAYTVEQGEDLFILCGQDQATSVMSDADFAWLGETLAANAHRRCFVFIHPYMEEDSGDAMDVRENSIFDFWGAAKTNAFKDLLRQYPNVVLFHGHSHMKFQCQELDLSANYTEKNGFQSVHVPSLGVPRDVDTVKLVSVDDHGASQGYVVDVYPDGIHLRGWDFVGATAVPIASYWLGTTLQTVEAGTYIDPTGTIVV